MTAEAEAAGAARDAAELKLAALEQSVPELELQNEGIQALVDGAAADAADYQLKMETAQQRVLELELLYKVRRSHYLLASSSMMPPGCFACIRLHQKRTQ